MNIQKYLGDLEEKEEVPLPFSKSSLWTLKEACEGRKNLSAKWFITIISYRRVRNVFSTWKSHHECLQVLCQREILPGSFLPHSQTGTGNLPDLINPKSVSLGTAEDAQPWE